MALSAGHAIEAEDLGLNGNKPAALEDTRWPPTQPLSLPAEPAEAATSASDTTPPLPSDLVGHLDQVERDILVRALEKNRLNRTATATSLGLSLRQMRYRMARLGIHIGQNGVEIGERFMADAADATDATDATDTDLEPGL